MSAPDLVPQPQRGERAREQSRGEGGDVGAAVPPVPAPSAVAPDEVDVRIGCELAGNLSLYAGLVAVDAMPQRGEAVQQLARHARNPTAFLARRTGADPCDPKRSFGH